MSLRKGQRTGNNGNHGAKGRSGRKPSLFAKLKQRVQEEKADDAEYAFALYAEVMRDASQPLALRLGCADWIADRVLGKPKENIKHSGDKDAPLVIDLRAVDYRAGMDALKPVE